MKRRGRKRTDEEEVEDVIDFDAVERRNQNQRGQRKAPARRISDESTKHDMVDGDTDDDSSRRKKSSSKNDSKSGGTKGVVVQFSQLAPEMSQQPVAPNARELNRLSELHADTQEKMVLDLARLILFKGLAGEPMDRLKIIKEAFGDKFESQRTQVANAALAQAAERLSQTFGFELSRAPKYMEVDKHFPCSKAKIKDRLYLINKVPDDENGTHSKAIQSIHIDSAVEKGLLMLILAFIYCKGDVINEGSSRWITAPTLYKLLHAVDEHLPAEPPSSTSGGRSAAASAGNNNSLSDAGGIIVTPRNGTSTTIDPLTLTPNVDALLEKFVQLDYLLKMKLDSDTMTAQLSQAQTNVGNNSDDSAPFLYSMGPRAALEIGRKQVLIFCAEILDEQPDPTMLAELNDDSEEEGEGIGLTQEEDDE